MKTAVSTCKWWVKVENSNHRPPLLQKLILSYTAPVGVWAYVCKSCLKTQLASSIVNYYSCFLRTTWSLFKHGTYEFYSQVFKDLKLEQRKSVFHRGDQCSDRDYILLNILIFKYRCSDFFLNWLAMHCRTRTVIKERRQHFPDIVSISTLWPISKKLNKRFTVINFQSLYLCE